MNRLIPRLLAVLIVACTLSVPAGGGTALLFDYVGFDYEDPDPVPGFGELGDGYNSLGEVLVLEAPLVSNQVTHQYTYYVTGLTVASRTPIGGDYYLIGYSSPGTITIYEDSRSTGTAANYGTNPTNATAPLTFTDGGNAILVGDLIDFRIIYNAVTNQGSFEADFKATGGTQYGLLNIDQREGWTFAGMTGGSETIPEGYDHQVDGQTFVAPPTPTQTGSWGAIKARYR